MVAICLQLFIIRCPGHFLPHDERDKKKAFHMSERKMSRNVKPTVRLKKKTKYRLGEKGLVTCLCLQGGGSAL